MEVVQRIGPGTNLRNSSVVFKSDRDHGAATTANKTLAPVPAGTISSSNISLGLYPLPISQIFGTAAYYKHLATPYRYVEFE